MANQVTKDLGGITAYAAAVAAGYTGTKAQFETLMASYATVAQNAAASATAAANSQSDAEAYAKGTRGGTPVSSSDAAYHNNSKYFAEEAETFADSIDPDTLAKINGNYPNLTSGNAEQLHSTVGATDTEPFSFRTSGGSLNIGDREELELVGVDVAWNQLAPEISQANGWSVNGTYGTALFGNNEVTYTITAKSSSQSIYRPNGVGGIPLVKGHKYFASLEATLSEASSNLRIQTMDSQWVGIFSAQANKKETHSTIFQSTADTGANSWFGIFPNYNGGMNIGETAKVGKVKITDLTAFFANDPSIADYIYTLEQGTAGAGVAFFTKYFGTGYKAYDSGSLQSPVVKGIKMTGLNQWDEEWESGYIDTTTGNLATGTNVRSKNYIRVVPNTSYYLKSAGNAIVMCWYDADKNYIGYTQTIDQTRTSPTNACYAKFYMNLSYGTTYNHDICINLHWDGERDGEYEAYKEHVYNIDPTTLHGIMKIADGKLYADGDTYEADGTVTRKYGIVDLGSLDWLLGGTYNNIFYNNSSSSIPVKPPINDSTVADIICSSYNAMAYNSLNVNDSTTKGISIRMADNPPTIRIKDPAYSTTTALKSALSGVHLVYPLATPTTDTADPFTSPMIVDDWGTEEFIYNDGTTKFVPVGHSTKYLPNLKAKLEMSPDSPNGDGLYIVEQSNGINTYVPLASADTITNIITRLETLENA